jgi:hypothetical protein
MSTIKSVHCQLNQKRKGWRVAVPNQKPAPPLHHSDCGPSGSDLNLVSAAPLALFSNVLPTCSRQIPQLDRLARARTDFAFETTLSGLVYLRRLQHWKAAGYRIEIIFLRLPSPQLAFLRIAARVRQGGHHVPRADVLRRFTRSWHNFQKY